MNSVSQREKRSDHLLEKIRLVVCDLDGTLLKTDKTLDECIISIIQNKQYMFTVASGRSAVLVKDYVDALGVRMPYITNNGAQVYDAHHGCMKQYDIAQGEVGFIIELAKKMKIECHANSDSCIYTVGRLEQIRPFRDRFVGKLPIVDHALTEQITNDIIYKIVCIDSSLEKMNEFAKQVNLHCSGASCVRSEGNAYTVVNKEASKGAALRYIMDLYQIDREEVLVFGDNYNDLSMFKAAGTSVAMENADRQIREHADFVTVSNDENGVSAFFIRMQR